MLLFISCIAGVWLLFITPVHNNKVLHNGAQADSLLKITFSDFNIQEQQRSTYTTQIDSNFFRKIYSVSVPPSFSKTQFHAVLQHRFTPYGVSLPARVIFPDKDMHIHLKFKNTIFRTIKLATDEDLQLQRSLASLIFAFNGRPPEYLLNELISFGEPIPIAIIQEPPLEKPDWWNDVKKRYSNMYLWPKSTAGENLLTDNNETITAINQLEEFSHEASVLSFYQDKSRLTTARQQTSLSIVPAQNAILFNNEMNQSEFNQTFRTFVQRAREGNTPVAIIMGSEQTLAWTRRELNTFKKGGLFLTPPNTTF